MPSKSHPTSKGPTHGPDGSQPCLDSIAYEGWMWAGSAFGCCMDMGSINAYDILEDCAPRTYADILAYEV